MVRLRLTAWCAGLVLLAAPAAVLGQVAVDVIQPLSFGTLLPGMTQRVNPADPGRGEVLITTRGRITVTLQLPSQLVATGGATIPMSFTATDGTYQLNTGTVRTFDPRSPLAVNIPGNPGTLRIRFGGAITLAALQQAEVYGGSVTVQVVPN